MLAPLILGVFTFLMFDSLYFLGSKFENTSNLMQVLLWSTVPAAAAWLSYLVFCVRSTRQAFRLLFGPLSLAIAAMAAGTGFAAWISTNFLLYSPNPDSQTSWAEYVTLGPTLVLLGYYFGSALFLGLSSSFLKDEDREWMSRAMAGVLLFAGLWSLTCLLVLVVPRWVLGWHPAAQGATGALGILAGWLSSRSSGDEDESSVSKFKLALLGFARNQAALIFVLVLIVALSIATDLILMGLHKSLHFAFAGPHGEMIGLHQHDQALTRTQPLVLVLFTVALALYCWITARFVNVNTFSLHGLYRDRLVRAYLGASNPQRKASRFTGFAADDDLPMASLDATQKPLHVVNLTLNLVAARRLDWQQRKADAFTVTALACGNSRIGYRPTSGYGGKKASAWAPRWPSRGPRRRPTWARTPRRCWPSSSPFSTPGWAPGWATRARPATRPGATTARAPRFCRCFPKRWRRPPTKAPTSTSRTAATSKTSASTKWSAAAAAPSW